MEPTPLNDMRTPVQTMPQAPLPVEQHSQRRGVVMAVVFVALLLAVALVLRFVYPPQSAPMPIVDDQGNEITQAEKGTLVGGFPLGLLIDQSVEIKNSYAVSYKGGGSVMPTASFTIAKPRAEVISEYEDLLVKENWQTLKTADATEMPVTSISAVRGSEEVTIALNSIDGTTTNVTIAYVINKL